ncbi:hypothetical protein AAY473_011240 [Plecturocebus cupreus]
MKQARDKNMFQRRGRLSSGPRPCELVSHCVAQTGVQKLFTGVITVHGSLELLASSNPSSSAYQVAGTIGYRKINHPTGKIKEDECQPPRARTQAGKERSSASQRTATARAAEEATPGQGHGPRRPSEPRGPARAARDGDPRDLSLVVGAATSGAGQGICDPAPVTLKKGAESKGARWVGGDDPRAPGPGLRARTRGRGTEPPPPRPPSPGPWPPAPTPRPPLPSEQSGRRPRRIRRSAPGARPRRERGRGRTATRRGGRPRPARARYLRVDVAHRVILDLPEHLLRNFGRLVRHDRGGPGGSAAAPGPAHPPPPAPGAPGAPTRPANCPALAARAGSCESGSAPPPSVPPPAPAPSARSAGSRARPAGRTIPPLPPRGSAEEPPDRR